MILKGTLCEEESLVEASGAEPFSCAIAIYFKGLRHGAFSIYQKLFPYIPVGM